MSNLAHALAYARLGWNIFPLFYVVKDGTCSCHRANCKRIGKHPLTKNGLQDATTNEEAIIQWWSETPWANIGLATGHDGRVVMDIDDGAYEKDGRQLMKVGSESLLKLVGENEPLPETVLLKTGSGGFHHYFLTTEEVKNSASQVAPDIDVRGYGGYVILPPSNHKSGGKYEWVRSPEECETADLPDWLAAKMMKKSRTAVDVSDDAPDEEIAKQNAKKEKLTNEQLIKLLTFIPADCDRDTWWKVGAALKKELGDAAGWEAFRDWSSTAPDKFEEATARRHWESFEDKGITGGTIVHVAKDNGFRGFDKEAADGEDFRQNWVYVAAIKRFVDTNRLTEWDREQFDAMFLPLFERGKPSEHVLRNAMFRHIESATYAPAKDVFIDEDGASKLNYWRSAGVTPCAGDASVLVDHVKYLWPEGEEGNILLDYLAYMVQNPGEKIHWAVLIEGLQGTGKSFFAMVMKAVLGASNVRMIHNDMLHETFTGWQRNTQLIIVEEMMARQRLELMNKLKPMITEPWCMIREMYRPPYEQPNRFNFLFFSNHRDSLIIDNGDRRYCILTSKALPHVKRNAYYGPLFDWTRKNAGVVLGYLLARDLGKFEPKGHAPLTEGKRALVMQSMMPLDSFIYEHVESQEYPFVHDIVSPATLVKPLSEMNLRVNPKEIGNALGRLGYLKLGLQRGDNGDSKVNMWAIRNGETYADMSGIQLRAVWLNQLNNSGGSLSDADAIYAARPVNPLDRGKAM